jgi:hypothetical protein
MTTTSAASAAVAVPLQEPGPAAEAGTFRRRVAGACLVLAPLAFSAAELLGPEGNGTSRQVLDAWAAHRTPGLLSCFAGLAATLLFLPGVAGMLQPVVGRGRRAGHIAAATILYGLVMAHAALVGVNLVFYTMTDPSLDPGQMVRLGDVLLHEPAVGAPLLFGHYLFSIGIVALGIAVIRSGLYPRWTGIALIVALVTDMALGSAPLPDHIGDVVSEVFLVAGFGAIGLQLLKGRRPA